MALQKQQRFGQSKHTDKKKLKAEAKKNGTPVNQIKGIYSTTTYKNYCDVVGRYINWIMENHRNDVNHYLDCQKYASEWLQAQEDKNLSAWSIRMYGAALACSFGGLSLNELNYNFPERKRADVHRNRFDNLEGVFRSKRQQDAYKILIATGCRRAEILRLRKEDFRKQLDKCGNETGNLEVYKRGKGGVKRWCLVNPEYTDFVTEFLKTSNTFKIHNEDRLFMEQDITKKGIHSCRAIYACNLYDYYMEHGYASGELYHCRKELAGLSYDKAVLEKVSYDLQHSRANVVINYLWLKQ